MVDGVEEALEPTLMSRAQPSLALLLLRPRNARPLGFVTVNPRPNSLVGTNARPRWVELGLCIPSGDWGMRDATLALVLREPGAESER